ncbi:MAG: SDR family NAD(P)-dependent oxidoreductase [Spirochaetia bacterium]|nr:SDR family NAD(P)-dependent oxidoreductase [Spirochaetia bacterium]
MNKYLKEYKWSNIAAMLRNNKSKPAECHESANGKLVLISGATSGIGYYTALEYASHGADLICINRNREKSKSLKAEISQKYGVACDYYIADYTHLSDVIRIGKTLSELDREIDVLIHNAGVFLTKKTITKDGYEQVYQVNFLSSFILTYMLMDKLKTQNQARIIYVNSEGHRFSLAGAQLDDPLWERHLYTGLKSYGVAKTAQLLSLIPFSENFKDSNVTINAIHPGDVKTNMGENNGKIYKFFKHLFINTLAKSPKLSAIALYYLGVSQSVKTVTGKFFNFTTEEIPAPHALDAEASRELWEKIVSSEVFRDI